jgi:hypothetical protein
MYRYFFFADIFGTCGSTVRRCAVHSELLSKTEGSQNRCYTWLAAELVEAPLEGVLFTVNYYQRRKEVRTGVIPGLLPNEVYFEELLGNLL